MMTRTRRLFLVLSLLLAVPGVATAGVIRGRIVVRTAEGDQQIQDGARVTVVAPRDVYSTTTRVNGAYAVSVGETGRCRLVVYHERQTPSYVIDHLTDQPLELNLRLERNGNTWRLVKVNP